MTVTTPARAADSTVLLIMPFQDPAGERILEAGCGRIERVGLDPDEIAKAIVDVDAVVVRGPGYLSAEHMDAATRLRFISVSGAGYDCVDMDAATERGLPVIFYPGFSARPVAEYVVGALVVCARMMGTADRECRDPGFDWKRRTTELNGSLLEGATLGLVGVGRIGRIVAELANAFGMTVIAYDPYVQDWPPNVRRFDDVDQLLAESDFVSLNAPLTKETNGLLSRARIDAMKPGACLVNAGRGETLDEQAVTDALNRGHLAYGVFDVFASEPDVSASPLVHARNALLTPHTAGVSVNTTRATCVAMGETVIETLDGALDWSRVVNRDALQRQSG